MCFHRLQQLSQVDLYDVSKYTRKNIASVAVHKSYFLGGPFTTNGRFAPLSPIS